jgi:hypothetical protein
MWVDWRRQNSRSPWQRVCEAETLDRCHKLLLAAVNGQNVKITDLFLTGGHVPPVAWQGEMRSWASA